MTRGQVRRRPCRQTATVVVAGTEAHVDGADPDVVQLAALAVTVPHAWTGERWQVPADRALDLAAALRSAGYAVRLTARSGS